MSQNIVSPSQRFYARSLLFLAFVIFCHSAYSVTEWRAFVRQQHVTFDQQQTMDEKNDWNEAVNPKQSKNDASVSLLSYFSSVPSDIVLETVIAFVISMIGVMMLAPPFSDIRLHVAMEKSNFENLRNRSSFYIFNHRVMMSSSNVMLSSSSSSVMSGGSSTAHYEIDPVIVHAIKLLHSKSPESGQQLKYLLDESSKVKKGVAGASLMSVVHQQQIQIANKPKHVETEVIRSPSKSTVSDRRDSSPMSRRSKHQLITQLPSSITAIPLHKKSKVDFEKSSIGGRTNASPSSSTTTTLKIKTVSIKEKSSSNRINTQPQEFNVLQSNNMNDTLFSEEIGSGEQSHHQSAYSCGTANMFAPPSKSSMGSTSKHHHIPSDSSSSSTLMDVMCCVCSSFMQDSNNQLLECKLCSRLFHQDCHVPRVSTLSLSWSCFACTNDVKAGGSSSSSMFVSTSNSSVITLDDDDDSEDEVIAKTVVVRGGNSNKRLRGKK